MKLVYQEYTCNNVREAIAEVTEIEYERQKEF